ncbi:hypothetical protein EDD16DRAFT_1522922 [Pisolithus croceorrhizus]|nr:hypothetical protein EDD16DRAFT_1522922 [Pisolithus croceorrhizus]KAI6122979.1 hypothetical protein EV401DRAFT_2196106 [Pisolithus croceorrhizus]KAI6148205.1 hypothetical protein EDD17DRAFT_1514272 [Pisolithus thermaeus]
MTENIGSAPKCRKYDIWQGFVVKCVEICLAFTATLGRIFRHIVPHLVMESSFHWVDDRRHIVISSIPLPFTHEYLVAKGSSMWQAGRTAGPEKKRKFDGCEGYSTRKRRRHDSGDQRADGTLKIRPGETISNFNRQMLSLASGTISGALRHVGAAAVVQPRAQDGSMKKGEEFLKTSTTASRRLKDIAQAPPEIMNVLGGAHQLPKKDESSGVLSMAQQVMMEEEQERVIK